MELFVNRLGGTNADAGQNGSHDSHLGENDHDKHLSENEHGNHLSENENHNHLSAAPALTKLPINELQINCKTPDHDIHLRSHDAHVSQELS